MKQFITLVLFVVFIFPLKSFSQSSNGYTYLVIRIPMEKKSGEKYYRIEAEEQNPNSNFINQLAVYKPGQIFGKDNAVTRTSDTTTAMVNYFGSISVALEYLDQKGWKLFSIYNQVGEDGRVYSYPVYYMRKEIHDK